jgi:hypothetical protein
MHTDESRPTLRQVRTLHPFAVPEFARLAGVEVDTVYHALQRSPIQQEDADKILNALAHSIGGGPIAREQVDIVVWNRSDLLWLVRAGHSVLADEEDHYTCVYARNRSQAERVASAWFEQHPHLPHHSLHWCPDGLGTGDYTLPGVLSESS